MLGNGLLKPKILGSGAMTAKKKKQLPYFPDEYWGKPVKVEFTNQGDINEVETIVYPDKEQYPKVIEPIEGANVWDKPDSEKPKPLSNQQRLKDLFGDRAE
jgi:hypothetical protein